MGRRRKKKAKSKSKLKHRPPRNTITPMEELSADVVLFHILPQLPAKSLHRFRFVSKQWYSFVTTPEFAHMHLQHQMHHKLLFLSDTNKMLHNIDYENPKLSVKVPFPFKGVYVSIVTSFHGMVCVHRIEEYGSNDLILWNPVTRDYKTLSKTGSHILCYDKYGGMFQLYYSSSDDDYKLLRITRFRHVYIYSLKSDSWRKVDSSPDFRLYNSGWMPNHALLNEKLYFLVENGNYEQLRSYYIRFDTKTEKFTEIAIPCFGKYGHWFGFFVIRGCIHLYFHIINGVELWKMNEDGDGDWIKVESFSRLNQETLHLLRNENWLMHKDDYLYQVDMRKHTKKRLCLIRRMTNILEYMETIVTPNQYTK